MNDNGLPRTKARGRLFLFVEGMLRMPSPPGYCRASPVYPFELLGRHAEHAYYFTSPLTRTPNLSPTLTTSPKAIVRLPMHSSSGSSHVFSNLMIEPGPSSTIS